MQADALALYRWMEQQCMAGTCVPNAAAAIIIAAEASQVRKGLTVLVITS